MTHALLLTLALALSAPGDKTVERGKELFSNLDLGVNGKTCVQCHAGGKSFDPDEVRDATSKDLGIFVNHCLTLRMKTPKLPLDSPDLQSLVLYVKTFRSGGH